jgi:hypothetical protein
VRQRNAKAGDEVVHTPRPFSFATQHFIDDPARQRRLRPAPQRGRLITGAFAFRAKGKPDHQRQLCRTERAAMDDLTTIAKDTRRISKDARSAISVVHQQVERLIEGVASGPHRPAGLTARFAACQLLARSEKRHASDVAKQHFRDDRDLSRLIELRSAMTPAQTTVATWAAELAAVVVQDIADSLLPASALAQLRAASGQPYAFIDGAVAKVPVHAPTPSGGFVLEAGAIPVGALILTALTLKPKKAASITAITRELLQGSPLNVELSLQTLLSQDIGLMIDNILLGNAASTAAQPAGILNGVTPLTATASTGAAAVLGDVKQLLNAIAPAIRPTLIMNATAAASIAMLAQQTPLPVITAPYLTAGTVIAVDAAAFVSALGMPDFSTDENPAVHMSDAPLPIVGGVAQPPVIGSVAAPVQSLWQTACIGMRSIIEADWLLRRTGAVAVVTGVAW